MTSGRARTNAGRFPRRVAWVLGLACLLPGGCRSVDPTEILLKVDSNLYPAPVGVSLMPDVEPLSYDTIVVSVLSLVPDPTAGTPPAPWEPGNVNAHVGQLVQVGDGFTYAVRLTEHFSYPLPPLPIEIGIVPRGGDPARVVFMQAAALRHGHVVTHSEARMSFAAHRITTFRILLSKECLSVDCAPGRTCRDGRCERVGVDPACLPSAGIDAGPVSTHDCMDGGPYDAGPPDAGPPDAGPPDAGPPDAGPPPGALPCGQTFTGSGFDGYITSMTGSVTFPDYTHRDASTTPSGMSCAVSCTEPVLMLADGASISGVFVNTTMFQVQAANSNDSGMMRMTVCGSTQSFNLYYGGGGLPGFESYPSTPYAVPAPGRCNYTLAASGGAVYIRWVTATCP